MYISIYLEMYQNIINRYVDPCFFVLLFVLIHLILFSFILQCIKLIPIAVIIISKRQTEGMQKDAVLA